MFGEQVWIAGGRLIRRSGLRETIDKWMAHEFDGKLRHPVGVPFFFERKNREHQVEVGRDLFHTPLLPCPELGRNVGDDLRLPFLERTAALCLVFANRPGEAEVEPGVIDEDDRVRFVFRGKIDELLKQASKLGVVFQHLPDTDDGVFAEVEFRSQPGGLHFWPTRADEFDVVAARLFTDGGDEFRPKRVAARFPGDEQNCFASVVHSLTPNTATGSGSVRSISSSR